MEVVEVSGGARPIDGGGRAEKENSGRVRVKRKTLEAVLGQCQQTLELLSTAGCFQDDDDGDDGPTVDSDACRCGLPSLHPQDGEADMFCSLLKSRFERQDFLKKLESAPHNSAEEGNSWDMITENDIWEGGNIGPNEDDYVLVRQDDIVDGIACFMAAYLLSLKETKDLSPNQLQDALRKTFSLKKERGKLRKAWEGSKVIYNVASWGATAIGICQNPAILRAASAAFWTSCRAVSKIF